MTLDREGSVCDEAGGGGVVVQGVELGGGQCENARGRLREGDEGGSLACCSAS